MKVLETLWSPQILQPVVAGSCTSFQGSEPEGQRHFPGHFPSATHQWPPINRTLPAQLPLLWVNQFQGAGRSDVLRVLTFSKQHAGENDRHRGGTLGQYSVASLWLGRRDCLKAVLRMTPNACKAPRTMPETQQPLSHSMWIMNTNDGIATTHHFCTCGFAKLNEIKDLAVECV